MNVEELQQLKKVGAVSLLLIGFFSFLLGMPGFVALSSIILFLYLPAYLLLGSFAIKPEERFIFSFFIGVGIFPSLAYLLGLVISFKAAIITSFVLLLGLTFLIRTIKARSRLAT